MRYRTSESKNPDPNVLWSHNSQSRLVRVSNLKSSVVHWVEGDGAVPPSLFGVSDVNTISSGLEAMALGLAVLLLCSALSVDVTSQLPRLYLELRKSFGVSETFLERSRSLLLLIMRQMWLLHTTRTKCCADDILHAGILALDSLSGLFGIPESSLFAAGTGFLSFYDIATLFDAV